MHCICCQRACYMNSMAPKCSAQLPFHSLWLYSGYTIATDSGRADFRTCWFQTHGFELGQDPPNMTGVVLWSGPKSFLRARQATFYCMWPSQPSEGLFHAKKNLQFPASLGLRMPKNIVSVFPEKLEVLFWPEMGLQKPFGPNHNTAPDRLEDQGGPNMQA